MVKRSGCYLAVFLGLLGCAHEPVAIQEKQEWLRPPLQRPSLIDVEKRVAELRSNPEKNRTPLFPKEWPPQTSDGIVLLYSVKPLSSGGEMFFPPSHRIDLEVAGELSSITGLGQDVIQPLGELERSQKRTEAIRKAEEALIHVLTGRKTAISVRTELAAYRKWWNSHVGRRALIPPDAAPFVKWIESTPSSGE